MHNPHLLPARTRVVRCVLLHNFPDPSSHATLHRNTQHNATAQVWDLATGACLRSIRHGSTVNACAFSADGSRLVSACYDSSLKVWDVATALNVFTLTGHTGAVNGVLYLVR